MHHRPGPTIAVDDGDGPGAPNPAGALVDEVADALACHRRARHLAQRTCDATLEAVDRCASTRTVPRGAGPDDGDRRPGVDPDVWRLHVRFHRSGDPTALDDLVHEYDRYATSLALRMHRDHERLDDLEQIAREGLIAALRRFDPNRRLPFPALATPTILGAIRRHYRDRGWAIRVPRRVHELAVASRRTEEHLTALLGRAPRVEEIAADIGASVDELLEVHDAVHARNTSSLDDALGPDGEDAAAAGAGDPLLLRVDDHLDLRAALDQLDSRDREIVRRYFFEEQSQSTIAAAFGVSQMQVSRWLASILRRMRVRVRER